MSPPDPSSAPPPLVTTVSAKGQVVLPKAVRARRDWPSGTRLIVEETPDGVLLRPAAAFPATQLDAVFGCLAPAGPPLSPAQMDAAVAAEARRRARD